MSPLGPVGFTSEIASFLGLLLSPFLSGSLLLALAYGPRFVSNKADDASTTSHAGFGIPALQTTLSLLFALGLISKLNAFLNGQARNAGRSKESRSSWDWPSEIAVVTGGSSGIGLAIVEQLSALGVSVAILDIQKPPASVTDASKTNKGKVSFFHCDLTDLSSVQAAASSVQRTLGHPSILVNNAGVGQHKSILETPEPFLRTIMALNCTAHWFTVQQFLPEMIARDKGHVVTVSSVASFVAAPYGAAYYATKAGAMAFHEALGEELRYLHKTPGVLTTIVHPSYVRTPLISEIVEGLDRLGMGVGTTEDLAVEVIGQLKKRESGRVVFPKGFLFLSTLRAWPDWMQALFRRRLASLLTNV